MKRAESFDVSDQMRCYFHLVKDGVVLTDDTGVEAADPRTAVVQILMTLHDNRMRDPDAEDDWRGWRLDIVDRTGGLLGTISLDESGQGIEVAHWRWQHA
jgi:hypothetical protein